MNPTTLGVSVRQSLETESAALPINCIQTILAEWVTRLEKDLTSVANDSGSDKTSRLELKQTYEVCIPRMISFS